MVFTRVVFTATYIYFKNARTFQSLDPIGILGTTLLVTGDTKKFFLPYVFFQDALPTITGTTGNLKYCFDIGVSESFLKVLFPQKINSVITVCLLDKMEKENIGFILTGIERRVHKNHANYNHKVAALKTQYSIISTHVVYIMKNEPRLRKEKIAALVDLWTAKGNLIRTSLSTSLPTKLDEFEMNYSESTEIKEFFCENYVVNDSSFYHNLVMTSSSSKSKTSSSSSSR